ncbi:hypothetical protein [Indiicoccus explosivorum]|uniref:hypothetical protein n=1 Tax=Indiicoccus explosivorum TaxID=1917864 RepID=UPI00118702E9|nr:hypothetical protein [Indiicoccus explosivorum]
MNTYAELYGNIKKRPLKSGLDNKKILDDLDTGSGLAKIIEETGKTTNRLTEVMESMKTFDTGIPASLVSGLELKGTSALAQAFSEPVGIKGRSALSISNYRGSTG